jgi:hypothetical protein
MNLRYIAVLPLLVLLSVRALRAEPPSPDDIAFFEAKIRPVLIDKCYKCHGADEANRKAGLRVDSREALRKGGENGALLDGAKPNESLLLLALRHEGPEMPPDGKLPATVIADFEAWVKRGAPDPRDAPPVAAVARHLLPEVYEKHWALQPIRGVEARRVSEGGSEARRVSEEFPSLTRRASTIDELVLAKLAEKGLSLSPPAEKSVLLRRVTYDLVGLPPTAEELAAFEADASPEAFARVVDRLLASPHYGERWGRHWLDVARFADTKDGVLMFGDDRVRPYAYTYRDYVIRAMNDDTPVDRFFHEQLAADQLQPPVEPWRLAAMGLLTLGRMFDNNVHDIIDDQIDTVTRGMLGLTAACARCHDHKYDPIPQADYYSLYGVLAASELPIMPSPIGDVINSTTESQEFDTKLSAKRDEILQIRDQKYTELIETARQRTPDYLVRVATTRPDIQETAIFFLSLQPNELRPQIVGQWRKYLDRVATPDDPIWGLWSVVMALQIDNFTDNCAQALSGWGERPIHPRLAPLLKREFKSRAEFAQAYGEVLRTAYEESKTAPPDDARAALAVILTSPQSPAYFPKSRTRDFLSRTDKDAFGGKLQELDRMAVQSPHAPPRAMVMVDSEQISEPKVFIRGNASNPGETVPRRFLKAVEGEQRQPYTHGSGRLDLAKSITSPSNPLTARVFVNRVWMHHFGEPLVANPSDFGLRTAAPVQLELLDYLAATLMERGWSLKELHRVILLSATYQQASADRPECRAIDPENRLLWRANRRRLDLEQMRDTLLSLSGRLDAKMLGRPTNMAGDPADRRRTVYGMVDRQSLPGLFRTFDFASPDQSSERRPFTTVPQQALFGLNSPFVVQQARDLVQQMAGDDEAKFVGLYQRVLNRGPTANELSAANEFVASPPARSQLTGWEQLAQVLLLTNELVFVD